MKRRLVCSICVTIVVLSFSSLSIQSQITKTRVAAKSKAIPLAPCAQLGSTSSCKTFNEMLASHDEDFSDLQETSKAYICFRSSIDSFFRINFLPFHDNLYRSAPADTPEFVKNGILSFDSYLNGQNNGNYLFALQWFWTKNVIGTAEATPHDDVRDPNGIQALTITETDIHLEVKFQNVNDEDVKESIDIRRSTGRYNILVSRSGQHENEEGRCVIYPR